MHKGSFGRFECIYNTGSSRYVERWLYTSHKLEDVKKPLWEFEGKLDEDNKVAEEVWQRAMAKLQRLKEKL